LLTFPATLTYKYDFVEKVPLAKPVGLQVTLDEIAKKNYFQPRRPRDSLRDQHSAKISLVA
jgi:hypothetical protein